MRLKTMFKYLCFINFLTISASCSGIQEWNAYHDFALESNPSGPWTYGWLDATGQMFTPYNTSGKTPEGFDCWWSDNGTSVGGVVVKTGSQLYETIGFRFPPAWLAMHPGPVGQRATMRWTAPASYALRITARFAGLHGYTSTDVHIYHNKTAAFTGHIKGLADLPREPAEDIHSPAFKVCQTYLQVQENDTIDISIGYGDNKDYSCDYTGVQISLVEVAQGLGTLAGTVQSVKGLVQKCEVRTNVDNEVFTTYTDDQGSYRLVLPAGDYPVWFKAKQYELHKEEVSLTKDAELDCSVRLNRCVDFSYARACPHRMTASWPGASDKTLLDVFPDHLRISWTYHNMTEVDLGGLPIQRADYFIEIWPSLDGKPFAEHRWTRPDGGLPVLEDNYTSEDTSIRFEYIGGRETMIVRVTATNSAKTPKAIAVRCIDRGQGEALRWFDPNAPGDALVSSSEKDMPQVSFLVSGPANHLRDKETVFLLWRLQPGETKTGWLLRPYNLSVDSLSQWRRPNWETEFNKAKDKWVGILSKAMTIQLPDKGVEKALYAAMGDILTMQEPASNGILTQTTGSEVYRFSNAGDCAAAVVALAQCGFLDNAMEVFQTQFFLAQPNGNWAGGWAYDFVAFSGFKSWVAMEFYHLNHDRAFLEKLYPFMLSGSRWHEKRRSESRKEENGKPIRGFGLIQPSMADCGMMDKSGRGVFIPHNIWTVYADKITMETARLLGRPEEEAEIAALYQKAFTELMACIESGSIEEEGYRWIPSSPNDPSGSFWGVLNLVCPCELVPFDHPLLNGTMQKMESMIGKSGLTKHTGWLPEGMWVAVNVDNIGMTHLFRGELDKFSDLLYAALNHATPLYTLSEEQGQEPGSSSSGDLQDVWAQSSLARAIRYSLVMERDQSLMIARAIPREWLASGKSIKVKDAPSHFGKVSYQIRYNPDSGKITGSLEVPKEYPPEEVRIYLRLPSDWSVQEVDSSCKATLDQEVPLAVTGDTCPVLIWQKAVGKLNFSVRVMKGDPD